MDEEYREWHISVSKTDVLEVCKLQHFVVWTAKSPTNSIRSLTNTSAVTTPFILHVVTKACKINIKTGIRCTCCDKLEYKIKTNYKTLMCMYTHSVPHTTARVLTVQHLRTIHGIILKLSHTPVENYGFEKFGSKMLFGFEYSGMWCHDIGWMVPVSLSLKRVIGLINPKDKNTTILQKVANHPPTNTVLQARRLESSASPLWEIQISQIIFIYITFQRNLIVISKLLKKLCVCTCTSHKTGNLWGNLRKKSRCYTNCHNTKWYVIITSSSDII